MKQSDTGMGKRQRLLFVLAILAAVALMSLAGATAARYVFRQEQGGLADAQNFYFTSDLLEEEAKVPRYYIDPQLNSFSIRLSNAADSLRATTGEIAYRIMVEGGSAEIDGAAAATGVLPGGAAATATLTVTPSAGASQVTVAVTSTKPYEKTLKAVFELALGNQYIVEDSAGNTAAVLTMICTDSEKEIALALPAGVVPDNTDRRVTESPDGGYVFQSPGSGVYSLVLLKTDKSLNLSKESQSFADTINLSK